METAFLNGEYLPKKEIKISPDDRGFLFAEGIYEVVKWYGGFFYDMESHLVRLKGSLRKTLINWPSEDSFPEIARELVRRNDLENRSALVYFQVTRGSAERKHAFPVPPVSPTIYGFAKDFIPENKGSDQGIGVMLKEEIRWKRCDIKSIALLPNTLSFQEALEKGYKECAFIRDDKITECTHSNIFFVVDGVLCTHPESEYILSGVTRKNILRIARNNGLPVSEEAVTSEMIPSVSEAFVTNTSGEIIPVNRLDSMQVGNGEPGPMTRILKEKFNDEICFLKH